MSVFTAAEINKLLYLNTKLHEMRYEMNIRLLYGPNQGLRKTQYFKTPVKSRENKEGTTIVVPSAAPRFEALVSKNQRFTSRISIITSSAK